MGIITPIVVFVVILCALGLCKKFKESETDPYEEAEYRENRAELRPTNCSEFTAEERQPVPPKAHLGSAVISCILSLVIYGTLRFYAEWFTSSQLNTIFGGFVSSWLFLFSLTSVSNVEMLLFGDDFASKFIPEIFMCLLMSVLAAGVVHRVCATTCILFSILALYFVDRISNECYHKSTIASEAIHPRKGGGKKNK